MAGTDDIRCMTCGQATGGHTPRFNTLENGELCPACRDRVLEAIQPALPSRSREEPAESQETPALFGPRLVDEGEGYDALPGDDDYEPPIGA